MRREGALWEMTWVELKLFLREPLTVMFVLVLPLVILYVLNGVFGFNARLAMKRVPDERKVYDLLKTRGCDILGVEKSL